jgi:hypothetical protein
VPTAEDDFHTWKGWHIFVLPANKERETSVLEPCPDGLDWRGPRGRNPPSPKAVSSSSPRDRHTIAWTHTCFILSRPSLHVGTSMFAPPRANRGLSDLGQ